MGRVYNSRMKRLIATLLVMPLFASAAGLPAGFAPGSVWLSKTDIEAGQSVQLYTVLYDSTDVAIAGNVSFLVDNFTVSSQPFELTAGSTKIVSAVWKATEGKHTVSAALDGVINKDTGEALMLSSSAAAPVSIVVASPPPPPVIAQAVSAATDAVQQGAPAVIAAAQSAYNSLEYLRENAVKALEGQIAASESTRPSRQILGTSTSSLIASAGSVAGETSGFFDLLRSVWQKFLMVILFISKTQILFYGSLIIVVLVFFKLLRVLMRERRHHYYDRD